MGLVGWWGGVGALRGLFALVTVAEECRCGRFLAMAAQWWASLSHLQRVRLVGPPKALHHLIAGVERDQFDLGGPALPTRIASRKGIGEVEGFGPGEE